MTDMQRPAGNAHPGQETPSLRKVSGDDLTTDAQHSTSKGATTTTPKVSTELAFDAGRAA
jgi:hypothetical protein